MKRDNIVDMASDIISQTEGRISMSKVVNDSLWVENILGEKYTEKYVEMHETTRKEFMKFFDKLLNQFGVKSPAELDKDKKKEFFDKIDAAFVAAGEVAEPGEKLNSSAITNNESSPDSITQTEYDKIPDDMKVTKNGQNFILKGSVLLPVNVIKEHSYTYFKNMIVK